MTHPVSYTHLWVNGVGCSLAWAGAFPSLPYTKNKEGRGPAFYGTLFEDQAENGLGVVLATKPVSYTHLDVYKRQVAALGVFAEGAFHGGGLLQQHIVYPFTGQLQHREGAAHHVGAAGAGAGGGDTAPVSYTHLV